ncbi:MULTISPECIES: transporter substrate-binding domain-containing protein [unclassified Rhizobium]|uniref:transporter substrate-binding domain-containing protein n=1 Tax=unclassified Rhizobium TaxID=2613769 RepID=UPI001ADCD506|nr:MULTISPECIES: transporter substrate-binding domain-containing protein [unclassified Rhizobium]MBO9098841.1 transporter substrate-binding domain-containing protein [Rhizobium sp. L58/93]MBO9132354.1 transporter substrate-binding domain-containing protein [Rhizobium sp. B209b/85]MBO9169107.1 transporter substrate-binding domain-containing protein [Rhizobium sp. L245/93]MBO9185057.1 transporter substrate-binding domain-containing protein [Rhizobium sp. E27B/91]QXZ85206.1 transporter substrate-
MKRQQFLLMAALAMMTVGTVSAPHAARADALSDITARGSIRVAVPQDAPPFGTVGPDMELQGLDIDMAKLIASKLGVKAELVPVTLPNRIPYLQTNKADIVISSLGKNPDREKVIDFTSAYAPFFNGAFAPADLKITSAADLSGKTVAVARGAIEDLALTKIAPPDAIIKRFEDNNGTISAFLSGQVQVIVTGNVIAAAILEKNPPNRPELKFLMNKSPCYIGLNKNEDALKGKINEIIAAGRADGSMNKITQKWLHQDIPADL